MAGKAIVIGCGNDFDEAVVGFVVGLSHDLGVVSVLLVVLDSSGWCFLLRRSDFCFFSKRTWIEKPEANPRRFRNIWSREVLCLNIPGVRSGRLGLGREIEESWGLIAELLTTCGTAITSFDQAPWTAFQNSAPLVSKRSIYGLSRFTEIRTSSHLGQ